MEERRLSPKEKAVFLKQMNDGKIAKGPTKGRSVRQDVKLLYIRDYLHKHANKENPKQAKDIIDFLATVNIQAERKTIYHDIDRLKYQFNEPIAYNYKTRGYYIAEPQFTGTELAVLIDCVCNASFVTKADALRLTNKLKGLANVHDLPMLNPLSENNNPQEGSSILQNAQLLRNAIEQKKKISFQKIRYVAEHTTHTTVESETIIASPVDLTWKEEQYVLRFVVDYDSWHEAESKRFDVKKMDWLYQGILKQTYGNDWEQHYIPPFNGEDEDYEEDHNDYYGEEDDGEHCDVVQVEYECDISLLTNITITDIPSTYRGTSATSPENGEPLLPISCGRPRAITIRFRKDVLQQVASDLGVDAFLIPVDKYHFKVTITARIDTDFCEWIEGYGCCAKILSPQDAVDFFRAQHKDKTYNLKMLYEHNLEPTYLLTGEEIENLPSEELDLIRPDLHANIQTVIDDNMKLSYVVRKND